MSKSMMNPRRLKKTELQEELRKHGVTFSSSALKPELLSLYQLKVLPSGFSTDEDEPAVEIKGSKMLSNDQEKRSTLGSSDQVISEVRRSPRKTKKPVRLIEEQESEKLLQETRSSRVSVAIERLDSSMIDRRTCQDLTHKQLAAKLKATGVNVGPIGPTTRRLYERKLEKILAEAKIPLEFSDQDSSEQDEVEFEVEKPPPKTRKLKGVGLGCEEFEDKKCVLTDPTHETAPADSPAWQVLSFDKTGGVNILESTQLERQIPVNDSDTDHNCDQTKMAESSDSEGEENASPNASAGQTPYHPKVKSVKNVTPQHTAGVLPGSDHLRRMKLICESATKRPALYSRRTARDQNVEESVPPPSGMETTKPERRWLPFWVTIAIVSIIVTILYFVYITMEENPPRFLP